MKKWVKRICIALCVLAASITIFNHFDSKSEKTDDTTTETAQVQVIEG